jgi:hypothetical protein
MQRTAVHRLVFDATEHSTGVCGEIVAQLDLVRRLDPVDRRLPIPLRPMRGVRLYLAARTAPSVKIAGRCLVPLGVRGQPVGKGRCEMRNAEELPDVQRTAACAVRPGAARRAAVWVSVLATLLMAAGSVAGLVTAGLYGELESTASMLRGYDLVTLLVVVPVLSAALLGVRRASGVAGLMWVSMLAASVYTYAIYVFGTGFNDLFLVHVAVFSASLFALVLGLTAPDLAAVGSRLARGGGWGRAVAVLLGFLAAALGGMWVYVSLRFAITGDVPAGSALVETETVVHAGIVLDLALLVPAYAGACIGIWRGRPWGYVVGAVMLVSGIVHQIGYLVALAFQATADIPGATAFDAFEPVIAALFVVGAALLLAPLRGGRDGRDPR